MSYIGLPEFTYTGEYELINDTTDSHIKWRLKFKSSGTLTFTKINDAIDLFLVGGGGGGNAGQAYSANGGGGGGGYTKSYGNISVEKNIEYPIVVGVGGAVAVPGDKSSAFGKEVNGGGSTTSGYGSSGGSGGGGGGNNERSPGGGGSNGGGGGTGFPFTGGSGQGYSTREFWELDNDTSAQLYSSGGGGASDGGGGGRASYPGSGGGGRMHLGGGGSSGLDGIVIIRNADYKKTILIDATSNDDDFGYVKGNGWYDLNETASLEAIANSDYYFANWLLKGYTRLEYIENTGLTQYIDTGYKNEAGFMAKFKAYNGFCSGTLYGNNANYRSFITQGQNQWLVGTGTNYSYQDNYVGNTNEVDLSLLSGDAWLKIDGATKWTGTTAYGGNNINVYLFALNCTGYGSGVMQGEQPTKLYWYKLYDRYRNLIRDYIPVIRHSDGAIGLLDLVNLKFYGNSGTGKFIAGGIV